LYRQSWKRCNCRWCECNREGSSSCSTSRVKGQAPCQQTSQTTHTIPSIAQLTLHTPVVAYFCLLQASTTLIAAGPPSVSVSALVAMLQSVLFVWHLHPCVYAAIYRRSMALTSTTRLSLTWMTGALPLVLLTMTFATGAFLSGH
jgi:hypothetical protein